MLVQRRAETRPARPASSRHRIRTGAIRSRVVSANPYEALFARHRSAAVPSLWGWQKVLHAYSGLSGDAAVELPTGTGKTLVGLLIGEQFREGGGGPVAFLAGNKQLAQQVERQARDLDFPIVRFQGKKDTWPPRDVRIQLRPGDRCHELLELLQCKPRR